jgi:hypothetical protein
MPPSNGVAQLYPQAPSSLSVALDDSQGYGGGILSASTGVIAVRYEEQTEYVCILWEKFSVISREITGCHNYHGLETK